MQAEAKGLDPNALHAFVHPEEHTNMKSEQDAGHDTQAGLQAEANGLDPNALDALVPPEKRKAILDSIARPPSRGAAHHPCSQPLQALTEVS